MFALASAGLFLVTLFSTSALVSIAGFTTLLIMTTAWLLYCHDLRK